jgi:hypothetical protein
VPSREETSAAGSSPLPPRSGHRGRFARLAGTALDRALDLRQAALGTGRALDRAVAAEPARRVAAYAIYTPGGVAALADAVAELRGSRHDLTIALAATGARAPGLAELTELDRMDGGKLANLNRLLEALPAAGADWVLLLDDDVGLGRGFLDRLVLIAERFGLDLVQPALTHTSHTAWPVTRRRASLLRETRFVEMGPALLLRGRVLEDLTPFPEEGMGWGICLHWAALAERRGWRLGVADAVPVRHDLRPPASVYDRGAARAAADELLAQREHIDWRAADAVVATERRL